MKNVLDFQLTVTWKTNIWKYEKSLFLIVKNVTDQLFQLQSHFTSANILTNELLINRLFWIVAAVYWWLIKIFLVAPSPGQQAVGVPAPRKGNPSDHRRGERQEARRQTGQQLNTEAGSINCCVQNSLLVLVLLFWSITRLSLGILDPSCTAWVELGNVCVCVGWGDKLWIKLI